MSTPSAGIRFSRIWRALPGFMASPDHRSRPGSPAGVARLMFA